VDQAWADQVFGVVVPEFQGQYFFAVVRHFFAVVRRIRATCPT